MTKLSEVRQLSRRDRRLLLQSILLLPVVHVALILFGYARLRGLMEKLTLENPLVSHVTAVAAVQRSQEVARIVSIAARYGGDRAGCLRRSLLLWWSLRREKIPSQICFGVRMFNGKLIAHAWVEHNSIVLNDPAKIYEQYRVLQDPLPSTKSGL